MDILTTKTGREIPCIAAEISPTMHLLYLVLPATSIQDAAQIFCNDEETETMTYNFGNNEQKVFRKFTVLVDIVPEQYGTRIGMRQPYIDEVAQ